MTISKHLLQLPQKLINIGQSYLNLLHKCLTLPHAYFSAWLTISLAIRSQMRILRLELYTSGCLEHVILVTACQASPHLALCVAFYHCFDGGGHCCTVLLFFYCHCYQLLVGTNSIFLDSDLWSLVLD